VVAAAVAVALVAAPAGAGPSAGTAAGLTMSAPGGRALDGPWLRWARASLMPTVQGRVIVRLQRCPALPRAAGCVYRNRPRTVYIRPRVRRPRSVLLHELGHLFDLRVLNNRDRGRFRRIVRAPRRKWWAGKIPLAEQFAEAYSFCARYRRIASIGRYATYDYAPTRRQHRSVCALIVDAARDRAPAAPAPQAPPVTRSDPVPPPQPRPSPGTVPGSQPKPKPTPTPTPTPTPRPAPTVPPVPTIIPFP
jgi:hypothetical protein